MFKFSVPMLVIMVLYIRMGLKIRRRTLHSLGSVHGESRVFQSRKAIIRMLGKSQKPKTKRPPKTNSFVHYSRCSHRILHLLGPIPRPTSDLPLRKRLPILPNNQRMDVLHNRPPVLRLLNSEPNSIQRHVKPIPGCIPGDPVLLPRPRSQRERPHKGGTFKFPGDYAVR